MQESHVAASELFVSSGNAPEMFDAREEALDQIAVLVQMHIVEPEFLLEGYRGVYPMRGLWSTDGNTSLRNAAWLVRAARHGKKNNPVALAVVISECVRLVSSGGDLGDVVEALCELLVHP